jgi:hypothetical protein
VPADNIKRQEKLLARGYKGVSYDKESRKITFKKTGLF